MQRLSHLVAVYHYIEFCGTLLAARIYINGSPHFERAGGSDRAYLGYQSMMLSTPHNATVDLNSTFINVNYMR